MTYQFRKLAHSLYECKYHIVFVCTQNMSGNGVRSLRLRAKSGDFVLRLTTFACIPTFKGSEGGCSYGDIIIEHTC